jgi:chromate transporter
VNQLWQMGVAAGALLLSALGSASPAEVVLLAICAGLAVDLGARRALARARGLVGRRPPVALPEDGALLDSPKRDDRPQQPPSAPPAAPGEGTTTLHLPVLVGTLGVVAAVVHATGLDAKLIEMAVVYFRTGLGAYGGGFAIIPHLRSMVHAHNWITDRQFADAVAIGKLTPGPVLLLATFIGYLQHGWLGASIATVAILRRALRAGGAAGNVARPRPVPALGALGAPRADSCGGRADGRRGHHPPAGASMRRSRSGSRRRRRSPRCASR